MARQEYLGRSLKFPINEKFEPEKGIDLVLQDIQMLLLTNKGERVMRPDFGCNLGSRIWDNLTVVADRGIGDVTEAIEEFEPRVQLIEVVPTVDRSRGLVFFNIRFLIREANVERNLIFPFKPVSDLSQR